MSAAHRFKSCGCCGYPIAENDAVEVEPMVQMDAPIVYIPVLAHHSTFSSHPTWVKEGDQYVRRILS